MAFPALRLKTTRLFAILIVAGFSVLTAVFAVFIPRLRTSGDPTAFLPANHASVATMREIEKHFGSQDFLTVIVSTEGESIFTPEGLDLIRDLSDGIERLPLVDEVISLYSISHLQGDEQGMESVPLVPREPYSEQLIRLVMTRLLSWPEYRRFLYSDDFRSTQIVVKPVSDPGEAQNPSDSGGENLSELRLVHQIKTIIAEHEVPGYRVLTAGEGIANLELLEGITADLLRLVPGLLVVLLLILGLAFRSARGVFLPLTAVAVSNVWVLGIMALAGIPFTILGMVIPNLLMAVGSAYGIHLINEQQQLMLRDSDPESPEAHLQTVGIVFRRVSVPILLAALTTVAGFLSLLASPLQPMRHMGIFTAAGVAVSALCTLVLLPALLLLLGPGKVRRRGRSTAILPRLLLRLHRSIAESPAVALSLILALLVVSGFGVSRLTVGQPIIHFFHSGSEIRRADAFAGEHLSGTNVLSVMIYGDPLEAPAAPTESEDPFAELMEQTEIENTAAGSSGRGAAGRQTAQAPRASILTPELLYRLDRMAAYLETSVPGVVNVSDFASLVKRMNQVMHAGQPPSGEPLSSERLAETLQLAMADAGAANLSGSEAIGAILKQLNANGEQYYEIPLSPLRYGTNDSEGLRRLLAQYLFLYEGQVEGLLDRQENPERTLLTIQLENGSPETLRRVKSAVQSYAERRIIPLGYEVSVSGNGEQVLALSELIMKSQLMSILFALVFVFLVVSIAYRSLPVAAATLAPIVLTVALNFGLMGLLGFPLDVVTAMIAAIAIGIGIDYSIHFLSAYIREYGTCRDHKLAAQQTAEKTGRAIAYNAVSVASGFAVLMLSVFTPLNTVGIMMSLTMISSSVLAITILPFLLGLLPRRVVERLIAASAPGRARVGKSSKPIIVEATR